MTKIDIKTVLFIFLTIFYCFAEIEKNEYESIADQLMVTPTSAALAGSDLSIGSGASVESTPANLPFDSLNRISLSYAGYYGNIFSTSMLTFSSKIQKKTGISVLLGYIYVPDILDTRSSITTDDGELTEVIIEPYAASKMIFRAGLGHLFLIHPKLEISGGVALNAKRARLDRSSETGYGVGMDLGVRGFFPRSGISTALQLENATSSYTYWNENYQVRGYQRLYAGIGWEKHLKYLYGTLRLSYATPDLFANDGINSRKKEKGEDGTSNENVDHFELYEKPSLLITQGKIGAEFTIMRTVALRLGLSNGSIHFGAGLRLLHERTGLDFAYLTHVLGGTYQLSVFYNW
jgi:hypothetical protein